MPAELIDDIALQDDSDLLPLVRAGLALAVALAAGWPSRGASGGRGGPPGSGPVSPPGSAWPGARRDRLDAGFLHRGQPRAQARQPIAGGQVVRDVPGPVDGGNAVTGAFPGLDPPGGRASWSPPTSTVSSSAR